MAKSKHRQPSFKPYTPNQLMLLPPSLNDLIADNHPVYLVNRIIDEINIDSLIAEYSDVGCSSYHPRMLLKILVYGYLKNTYSSRKLEAAVQENIHFMWLCSMQQPDHNTINRFRSKRLKNVLKEIFGKVVLLLTKEGHIQIKQAYVDGTKLEANANKYTFVWGKRIKNSKDRIKQQLKEIWAYAESVAREELENNAPTDFDEIDSQKVKDTIDKINTALQDKPVDKKIKQKLNYAKKNWPAKLDEYKRQEEILSDRNSYSKTDKDATFMRMKDDHMMNGQLKAAYNWQISTNNQFILNYSIHQKTTDTVVLKDHLSSYYALYGSYPKTLVADAGYGSEENYEYLEDKQIDSYVKFNYFHKEQTKKWQLDGFKVHNLHYNIELDCYYCPMGQAMTKIGEKSNTTKTGFKQTYSLYQAQNCNGCPLRSRCHKAKGNRIIQVNHKLNAHKQKARDKLKSKVGLKHRSQRPQDVEAVFGNIKQNKGFWRFMLRGIEKVEIEAGLLALAHNLAKVAKKKADLTSKTISEIINQYSTYFLTTQNVKMKRGHLNWI